MLVRYFIHRFESELSTLASGSLLALLDSSSTAGRFLKRKRRKKKQVTSQVIESIKLYYQNFGPACVMGLGQLQH